MSKLPYRDIYEPRMKAQKILAMVTINGQPRLVFEEGQNDRKEN